MKPLISIIMPVYNAAETLGDAISSLKAQTLGFDKLEVIFADDASSDGSVELVRRYAEQNANVKAVYLERNSGFAGAPRNAALEEASAPYIMFLDADDRYTPRACEALLTALETSRADIAGGYFSERHDSDKAKEREISDDYALASEGLSDLSQSLTAWRPLADAMWCKIYRRNIIERNNIRFETGIPGEDVIFLAEYLSCCESGFYLKEKVIDYFVKDISVSHGASAKFYELTPVQLERLKIALEKRGRGEFFFEFVEGFAALDYYLGRLIAECAAFDDDTLARILAAWGEVCSWALESGVTLHGPLVRILARRIAERSADSVFACRCLAESAALRRSETEAIFNSRSWLAASKVAGILNKRQQG